MPTAATTDAIEYPSSDGQPMAETPVHLNAMVLLHQAMEDFFAGRDDVFIASDILWYWEEGNLDASISPDVMVVTGVRPRDLRERRSFLSWDEGGVVPSVVFEMASKSTWKADEEEKLLRYEELGVGEYFLFDPESMYLSSPLKGYRLQGTAYRRLWLRDGEMESRLGFRLRAEGQMLRVIDSRTDEPIPTRAEAVELARQVARHAEQKARDEEQRANAEQTRADALQAEVERLRAMLNQQGHANGDGP